MIVGNVQGDIFEAAQKHIAFAVNTEGENFMGFSNQVAQRFWPDLEDTGGNKLGEVLSRKVGDKTFHALVCHSSLRRGPGWSMTPRVLLECLQKIRAPKDEEIAIVLMGSGPVGRAQGANVEAILASMHRSSRKLVVYTR